MKYIKQFMRSMSYSWRGVVYVFTHEQNFRVQLLAAVLVVAAMIALGLTRSERVVLLLLIFLVLILELLNSALEKFVDILKPRLHLQVGVVKDIMAAMVLLASVAAAIIGFMIFSPYIIELVSLN